MSNKANPLLLKVCGLREPGNTAAVASLEPDFIGLIFYPTSPRYAPALLSAAAARELPGGPARVGVFVDANLEGILATAIDYGLDYAQLHGHETPADCAALQAVGLRVIKAIAVGEELDFKALQPFVPHVDFFLFDTLGRAAGGNGTVFDWQLLRGYNLPVRYLLAGGIGPAHAAELAQLTLPGLAGIDVNSGFETSPGLKDVAAIARFKKVFRAAE